MRIKALLGIFFVATLTLFVVQAQAYLLVPGFPEVDQGFETSQSDINAAIALTLGSATEVYKQDVGEPESGPLASSYKTVFTNSPSDPANATISYETGPKISCPECFLLVKGGKGDPEEPVWYLFDLGSGPTWNGVDTISLTGFWPDQGAISHVTLYAGETSVPEPATMVLFGTGLIGLAGLMIRRKL